MFSVIVPTYNSSWDQIKITLLSILNQNETEIDIIITDDGSDYFPKKEIIDFFLYKKFSNYKLVENDKNIGTVNNLLSAVKFCKTEFIKPIGPGDLLYSENILKEVRDFMEKNNYSLCFGLLQGYRLKDKRVENIDFLRPRVVKIYEKYNHQIALKNVILGDHPSGATLFYKKQTAIKYWSVLSKEKVRLCEDVITFQLLLDNQPLGFFPHLVVWYEMGNGISKRKNKKQLNTLMYEDIQSYIDFLIQNYPEENRILRLRKEWTNFQIKHKDNRKRMVNYLFNPRKLLFEISVRKNAYNPDKYKKERGFLSSNSDFLNLV